MKLLIDTDIFLEILLDQEASQEAKAFLDRSDVHEFFISDFSLHSICLILLRHRADDVLRRLWERRSKLPANIASISTMLISMWFPSEVAWFSSALIETSKGRPREGGFQAV